MKTETPQGSGEYQDNIRLQRHASLRSYDCHASLWRLQELDTFPAKCPLKFPTLPQTRLN